jgi:long-chain acyl-CoA synthetase
MNPSYWGEGVHAPLRYWANTRGDALAIDDGQTRLSFAALHDAFDQVAGRLSRARAPTSLLVNDQLPLTCQIVEFLGIVASGRCAALGDPDWTPTTRDEVRSWLPTQRASVPPPGPNTPFYIGFTSGSSGTPKGFRRHHRSWTESFRVCVDTFGADAAACILAPGRISHSLFLFGVLLGLWSGAGVVLQRRFSAAAALETLGLGRTPCLVSVPSQLVMMMELAARRGLPAIHGVRLILISGARWMRERTESLKVLFPEARVVEFYGASETSFISWIDADATVPVQVVGRPFRNVELAIRPEQVSAAGSGSGLIFVRSPMLFIDYFGPHADPTAALRDGDWLSVRDIGHLDAQGRLCLQGRQSRMIVTQGKNLFPEETEAVLASCPGVAAISVQGTSHTVRGQEIVGIVGASASTGALLPSALQLSTWGRARLERYKIPRRFYVCDGWPLTASGKTDHARLAELLRVHLDSAESETASCLQLLR